MFAKLTKWISLKGADRVLEARGKITAALEREVGKFQAFIRERLEAEKAVREAEISAALGEPSDTSGAYRRVEEVLRSIGRQASILTGLRSRAAEMAGELEREYRAVAADLPVHIDRVRSDFAKKWARCAAEFGSLLGERRAIEALIGVMDLPEAHASAGGLAPEIQAPWSAMEQLKNALTEIGGWNRTVGMPEVDAMQPGGTRPYDPTKVYVVTYPGYGFQVGEPVMEASMVPGALAHYVNIGYAVTADGDSWQKSTHAGQQAEMAISHETDQRARQIQEDTERRSRERIVTDVRLLGQ